MRLGAYTAHLREGTQIAQIYAKPEIRERHRHRYEVMNEFVPHLESAGLVISGSNPVRDLVETIELADHPWFIGCQYHPELKSKPLAPHPLVVSFSRAALHYKQNSSIR